MNILFTCVGRRGYLLRYFRENMQPSDRIVATDMAPSAVALQLADCSLTVPSVYDDSYIDHLLSICREHSISAIFSLNDLELPILAAAKQRFVQIGALPVISDPEVVDICFDKYRTALWVEQQGLLSPRSFVSLSAAEAALAAGVIHFPLMLKPRWGSGSIGLEVVDDLDELKTYHHVLQKKVRRSILAQVSACDDCIIIQEFLSGDEYGVDVLNDLQGNLAAVAVKRKVAMRAGETDKAVMVDNPEVEDIGERVSQRLRHIGPLDMDVMQRSDGSYCVIELNPRFGGGFPFSYEAGVNYPKALMQWLSGSQADLSTLRQRNGLAFAKLDTLLPLPTNQK